MAFSPAIDRLSRSPMTSAPGYFHLHLISDSTGETLITVARAAAAQYAKIMPVEHVHPLVRTQKQLDRVLTEIEEMPGIVLYTCRIDPQGWRSTYAQCRVFPPHRCAQLSDDA